MAVTYELSGKVSPAGAALATGIGAAVAMFLGVAYAAAIVHIPFAYLNPVLTAGFAAGVGYAVYRGALLGRVRRPAAGFAMAVGAMLPGYYAAWCADEMWRMEKMGFGEPFTLSPEYLSGYLTHYIGAGDWTILGGRPTGFLLAMFWLLELVVLVAGAGLLASLLLGRRAYCEGCRRWLVEERDVGRLPFTGFREFLEKLEELGTIVLRSAGRVDPSARTFLRMDLAECRTCRRSNYLSLVLVERRRETVLVHRRGVPAQHIPFIRRDRAEGES